MGCPVNHLKGVSSQSLSFDTTTLNISNESHFIKALTRFILRKAVFQKPSSIRGYKAIVLRSQP
eukprot:Awhi_evm1s2689